VDGEGIFEEFLFLLQVNRLQTGGHRGTWGATGVQNVAAVVVLSSVQQGLNAGLDVAP